MADFDRHKIRNICILAHVDHGKTTLADHLIASCGGGVLHPKQAGRLRFMDYLDEEQRRAITMKSSSISLQFNDYSINLIDSPGHMDFCSEVSTAARLSDGALVLVDAVEGVHIQTHAVLRQAWLEKLTPSLVLNKIDRLISELKLTPIEAYNRLSKIVREVNNIVSAYKSEKYLSDVDSVISGTTPDYKNENDEIIEDDEEDTFQPQKGNVAFVCALDGWGFGVGEFAEFYASKLGASATALKKALWGPYYYNSKTKMIVGKKGVGVSNKAQPMFVQFVLEPLWKVYKEALDHGGGGKGVLEKVIKSFNLFIPTHEFQNKDPRSVLQSVLSRWLPLSDSIMSMVVRCLPGPVEAQSFRISRLLPKKEFFSHGFNPKTLEALNMVRKSIEVCDVRHEAPCVCFVSKMFSVPIKMLPRMVSNVDSSNYMYEGSATDSDECFLAFARIFSGTLSAGQQVFVLSALYDPLKDDNSTQKHVQEAKVLSLYMMMGQGLKMITSARAGNLVAIRGLGQHILKSATLSSTRNCWPFSSMTFQVSPTLRVAIEPSDPADSTTLMKGLKLLNRADPFVEVSVSARGEHVLAVAGEVHLDRCIKDLKERFARVGLEVSPPLVSYKETIEGDTSGQPEFMKLLTMGGDYVEKVTANGRCVVRVHVAKLPSSLIKVLEDNSEVLSDVIVGKMLKLVDSTEATTTDPVELLRKQIVSSIEDDASFMKADKDKFEKRRTQWLHFLSKLWAFGPRHIGPNILIVPEGNELSGSLPIQASPHVSKVLGFTDDFVIRGGSSENPDEAITSTSADAEAIASSILSGFQLATAAGPLCDEPMWGLAFLIEAYAPGSPEESELCQWQEQIGASTGQIMMAVKDACKSAVLQKKPRLVEAMYFCELSTPTEYLGAMYAVLARRRARVVKEEMQESSSLFMVHAYVPVAESFGFADELRRWTSGASSALLVLSHWEELSEDPFFVPKTEEEIEEFGDGSSVLQNMARKLIDNVRRQKGLPVEEKIVQHATKQRTLARKV